MEWYFSSMLSHKFQPCFTLVIRFYIPFEYLFGGVLYLRRNFMTLCSIAIQPSSQSFGRDQPETHSLEIALHTYIYIHNPN